MRCAIVAAAALASTTFAQQLDTCAACHGSNGVSSMAETPSLAGQPAFFVLAQLVLFREGRRDNPAMNAIAKPLSNDDLRALAAAFEKLAPPPPSASPDPAKLARGRALAEANHCSGCHGADYAGGQNVPRVAYQREDYLVKALDDFKRGRRVGYGNAAMAEAVAQLSPEDLADLAHYLAHLPQ
jgi:cytochrome c553